MSFLPGPPCSLRWSFLCSGTRLEPQVHCTMSRTSGTGWRKQGGMAAGGGGGRSRRHSSGGGGDGGRAMSHGGGGGGQGFGGRPARSSMDGPGAPQGRGGGWGGHVRASLSLLF